MLRAKLVPLHSLARSFSVSTTLKANALKPLDTYKRRHNGSGEKEIAAMLKTTQSSSMKEFISKVVPKDVLIERPLSISPEQGFSETQLLERVRELASKNKVFKSYIGRGYYGTTIPPVVQRNLLENPQWYTSYTPYQAEISQGRLESLINFQTMIRDLTGMSLANASLLDEATAAAEAMIMSCTKHKIYYVHEQVLPQTLSVLRTRAEGLGIEIRIGLPKDLNFEGSGGCLIQYPNTDGSIPTNVQEIADAVHKSGATLAVAADLLSLALFKEPGSLGADIVLGTAQRFGVPLGFGGPHAAYFAVRDEVKRKIPGRIIGRSIDRRGDPAYRLALQTREQHIRREKATSNICTAQALLANISAMYAVYHGPEGIKAIAQRVYSLTSYLAEVIKKNLDFELVNQTWFDTLTVMVQDSDEFMDAAVDVGINLYKVDKYHVSVSLDETISETDFARLCGLFGAQSAPVDVPTIDVPAEFARTSTFLTQPVFNKYHSETEMLRYMTSLQIKDLSLANAMIPLGSCTMKLNATVQMMPITYPEFSNIHPFAPFNQASGYLELIAELESDLSNITGFAATTLQPNSGAQGEFTGLRVIQAYQKSIGQGHRNICLIPVSAHGTNPASAAMCGLKVVTVKCTPQGYLDLEDLEKKATKYADNLAAFMITYPSTYGSFEPTVRKAIDLVHSHGGQVYMDGANMNAQIGLTSPGDLGADVCHLNLHKTFCIPHGGGGPGVGPIGVASHLVPFLPNHDVVAIPDSHAETAIPAVSAAPWGSASILSIPWAYIKLMGNSGLKSATELAILNANYMMERLAPHYKVAFLGEDSRCAHEFIIDIRPFKSIGVEAIDVAKRLQDYSFHGPTMSWPVPNTLMIEPTESESKEEIDRMCDALISIREEIKEIEEGKVEYKDSVLAYAPHSLKDLLSDGWDRKYTREKAAFPAPGLRERKHWPTVARVDDTYGDLNLFCSCDPVEAEET